jgi:geranylgeranyl pyrophosphate synthase
MSGRGDRQAYERRLAAVNASLEAVVPSGETPPDVLHEAMRHAVFGGGGGKRLRPVILLTVAADLGVDEAVVLPAATALELIHNYSLVHDDLPCMDDASERRGAPSVHRAYGCGDAVLAGDALLTLAFEVVGRAAETGGRPWGVLIAELARAAGSTGMAGGQHADLDRGSGAALRLPGDDHATLRVHRLKTAKLFGFAFSAPCLVAPGRQVWAADFREAGEEFGLAFQIADDVRDAGEDAASLNYARDVGEQAARRMAEAAVARCLATVDSRLGSGSETSALVREAARDMGVFS